MLETVTLRSINLCFKSIAKLQKYIHGMSVFGLPFFLANLSVKFYSLVSISQPFWANITLNFSSAYISADYTFMFSSTSTQHFCIYLSIKKSRLNINFLIFDPIQTYCSSALGTCAYNIFDSTETTLLVGGLVGLTCYLYYYDEDYSDIIYIYYRKTTQYQIFSTVMLPNTERRQPRANKQIIFIICIYIILTVSNRFSANKNQSDDALIKKIQNQSSIIPIITILSQVDKQKFEGQWTQSIKNGESFLLNQKGHFQLQFMRSSQLQVQKFSINFNLKNGEYIDDGQISFIIAQLQSNKTNITHTPNILNAKVQINQTARNISFYEQIIFKTKRKGNFNLSSIQIIFQVTNKKLVKKVKIQTQNAQIILKLKKQEYNMSGTILFALILFLVAYSEFSACLQIMKRFFQSQQDPLNYSFVTLVMAMMWDAALCLTSFIQAFQNQQNIVLFIVPAFILCILFTNLELRIMITVFQANSGQSDIRNVICKFNFLSYGAIVGMYPLLVFSNMGAPLFIGFSLIFVPQIYTNAVMGKRPNPNSIYYNEFLLFRFLIVLYLRCFPYNIFNLKPDYLLGFCCLVLVAIQILILWAQKIYGPKKIFPKFLLPPVYTYSYNLTTQQQSSLQCTICLQALSKTPENQPSDLVVVSKIMNTPCNHKYHGCCLMQWMKLKMQCPQCRAKLPAYQ